MSDAPPIKAAEPSQGWFRAMRTNEARELVRANPFAFILAWVIADRGRYSESFNQYNLALGEALLGDFGNYGMTHKQYRTAVKQLEKWGFAAFRRTNKGTIAKLTDARLFSIFRLPEGNPNGNQGANEGQAKGKQGATNKNSKSEKTSKNGGRESRFSKTESVDPTK